MQKKIYKRIAKLKYKNKTYQMFRSENKKIFFLEFRDNKYYYPSLRDFFELMNFFIEGNSDKAYYNDEYNRHKKISFIPKIKYKTALLLLTSTMATAMLTGCHEQYEKYGYSQEERVSYEENLNEFLELDDTNIQTELQISDNNSDCYENDDFDIMKKSKYIVLYNNKYFEELFGVDSYNIDEINSIISSNESLDSIQNIIKEFANKMYLYYPNLDFRVFCQNVSTLNIVYQAQEEIEFDTSAVAYYNAEMNTITISEKIDFENPKDLMIFRHELGHLFNMLDMEKDGWRIKYKFNDASYGKYSSEAMDVILTTLPYFDEYHYDNMGYPIITNVMRVIVSSLPDYELEDSVSHNIYYLEKKLDENMKNDIDASVIIDLINLLWLEYSSKEIEVDPEEYKDLYVYVTELYIKNNVTNDMTYDDIIKNRNQLIETLLSGVEEYGVVLIDTQAIEEVYNNYIEKNNIIKEDSRHN